MGGSEKKRKRTSSGVTKKKKKSKRARSATPDPPSASPVPVAVCSKLPSKEVIQKLPEVTQDAFLTATGGFCERAIRCVHSGVCSLAPSDDTRVDGGGAGAQKAAAVEDIVLADMARLRGVPLAREYTDITLWRRLRNTNARVIAAVEGACEGVDETGRVSETVTENEGQTGKASSGGGGVSFRKARMQTLTERFADDLGKLHETEQMGSERVKFLLRCLEEGVDVFAGLFDNTSN